MASPTSPNTATRLNANAATTIAAGTSEIRLFGITINTAGATANTLTLTDGNGAVKAVIDTTRAGVGYIDFFGVRFNGLVVTIATGTAADVTVITG